MEYTEREKELYTELATQRNRASDAELLLDHTTAERNALQRRINRLYDVLKIVNLTIKDHLDD